MNQMDLSTVLAQELGYSDAQELCEPTSQFTSRRVPHVEKVFKVNSVPVVYFARLAEADPEALWGLHRTVWNESKVPLLYVVLPQEIRVYNGYALPAADSAEFVRDEKKRLLRKLTQLTDIETARQAIQRELYGTYDRLYLETGSFWATPDGQEVTPSYRADQTLLRSLARLRQELIDDGVPNEVAYGFIGRSLFACYLLDRDLLGNVEPHEFVGDKSTKFMNVLDDHDATYRFFEQLTERFGGDLFPVHSREKHYITHYHLWKLKSFLEGHDLVSGQQRLWPYDFKYIPIELISEIYDTFLQTEQRKELGAFYTPLSLVDFVLNETLPLENFDGTGSVLDPACGSGVFLVRAFQRIMGAWQKRYQRRPSIDTVFSIVSSQIFGIDKAEEAVQIAVFSLYLAMIDVLPPEEVKSPDFRLPRLIGRNLMHIDFFDSRLRDELKGRKFNRIVGNPPWGKGSLRGLSRDWANRNKKPVGGGQAAQAFLWRALEFCSKDGEIALLAPAKSTIFVSSGTHEKFRSDFFSQVNVRVVVNFSPLAYELFPESLSPTVALFYAPGEPPQDKRLVYGVPKPSPLSQHLRAIVLDATDLKLLDRDDLRANPELWKVASWGSPRDASLIMRLKSFPTLEQVSVHIGWDIGEGMQVNGGDENAAPWAHEIPYLPTDAFEPFVLNSNNFDRLDDVTFHRPRGRERYRAPLVLIHKSRCQAAFADSDLTYLDSITGIVGNIDTVDHMKVLVAYINSPLARYYQFLTSTRWAVERGNPVQEDYLRMPFVKPTADEKLIHDIVAAVDQLRRSQQDKYTTVLDTSAEEYAATLQHLNALVYELFNLTPADVQQVEEFVTNEIGFFQWAKRRTRKPNEFPTVQKPSIEQLRAYAETFVQSIQGILASQELALSGAVFTDSAPLTVVGFNLTSTDGAREVQVSEGQELHALLRKLDKLLIERRTETLYVRRHVRLFDERDVYLIRPSEQRFWSRSQARVDSDSLIFEWLSRDQQRSNVLS